MSKSINMNAGATVNGGVGIGLMTAAGNPWTVADGVADDLVNRGVASYVNPTSEGPMVEVDGPITSVTYAAGLVTGYVEAGVAYAITYANGLVQSVAGNGVTRTVSYNGDGTVASYQ